MITFITEIISDRLKELDMILEVYYEVILFLV